MLIVLGGRIACTGYLSVHGTLDAFQRFVQVLKSPLTNGDESGAPQCRANLPSESSSTARIQYIVDPVGYTRAYSAVIPGIRTGMIS
jgi:hypothetical protein